MKHGSSDNGDIWTSFFNQSPIIMKQNDLGLASNLEIFISTLEVKISKNACAYWWRKPHKECL